MKVIFLDIDGVLNSGDDLRSRYMLARLKGRIEEDAYDTNGFQFFDDRCCRWLEYIIRSTDAKIVISSTWRKEGLPRLKKLWEERKLYGEIIDITPFSGEQRGYQIQSWLDENDYVTQYVIIDDDNDMLFEQKMNFVKCQFDTGITLDLALKAVSILNGS